MNRKVLIVTATSAVVGSSILLANTFFSAPPIPNTNSTQFNAKLGPKNQENIFTGSSVNVSYGMVKVEIKVTGGRITDVRALEAPDGRSSGYSEYAIPVLREQTLAAQSADIQGASGASFTSFGWKTSLAAALKSANL